MAQPSPIEFPKDLAGLRRDRGGKRSRRRGARKHAAGKTHANGEEMKPAMTLCIAACTCAGVLAFSDCFEIVVAS